jgi:hypothetical protein
MHSIEQLFFLLFVLTIVAVIDFFFLIGSYGILRLLRISVNWVTWIIGTLIIMASAYCYGLWIDHAVRKKRVAKNARIIHAIAAIAFFVAFLVHIGLGR